MGPIGLHGGGEYLLGDEPFLRLLLDEAAAVARHAQARVVRVTILPTAAARHRPDVAGRMGAQAFERLAPIGGMPVHADVVRVVDDASAADPELALILAAAHLIHLPGGDPDLVPRTLAGSAAWRAVLAACRRGAVLAGASAGAMALAEWTWTPSGAMRGLGVVRGLVVVPHFEGAATGRWRTAFEDVADRDVGVLGLDERTGALAQPRDPDDDVVWRIAGTGRATWIPAGAIDGSRTVADDGGSLPTPGVTIAPSLQGEAALTGRVATAE